MKIIIIKESLIVSIIRDIITYGLLICSMAINYFIFDNNYIFSIVLVILLFIGIYNYFNSRKGMTIQEAKSYLDYLEKNKKELNEK